MIKSLDNIEEEMLKLIKEFKPFTISIIIIIGLLFLQAMTDLALLIICQI